MLFLDRLSITWSQRPYFDLSPYQSGAWHIQGIDYSYRNLVSEVQNVGTSLSVNPVTLVHPASFREQLIREAGLFQYPINDPLALADELRTKRWRVLCEHLEYYRELSPVTQLKTVNLLSSLCFHKTILSFISTSTDEDIARDSTIARLAYSRAMSKILCQESIGTSENLEDFQQIAQYASKESLVVFGAAVELIALHANVFRELAAVTHWREVASGSLAHLEPFLNHFEFKRLTSVYHRAAVFAPLLRGEQQTVVREMDICQSLAEELTRECKNETERISAHENLTTVFESRTKEALWLGDIDLAEERAKKMVEMEPLYSRYRLQLGEVLLKQNKFEEAAKIYRSATRLGPPGMAIAWFMAGQCHERLGEIDIACDCYLSSVQLDELAISAVEKINKLAPRLGNSMLEAWSTMRLEQLREQQRGIVSKTKASYIPEAASALKLAGEQEISQV
jgi:tetratricopeptide (TPR) repeat protein